MVTKAAGPVRRLSQMLPNYRCDGEVFKGLSRAASLANTLATGSTRDLHATGKEFLSELEKVAQCKETLPADRHHVAEMMKKNAQLALRLPATSASDTYVRRVSRKQVPAKKKKASKQLKKKKVVKASGKCVKKAKACGKSMKASGKAKAKKAKKTNKLTQKGIYAILAKRPM